MKILIYGFATGILFGFLLQRGQVLRYEKQLGALRLLDMTIVKFMLSSILVAMVGIYLLFDLGLVKLSVKPTILGGNILGGLVFGVGWGLFGFCPGTAVGAAGEGRWGVLWGIAGMIVGAAVFAETYPFLKSTVLTWGNLGKLTLPQVLGLNHWIVIPVMIAAILSLFYWFEKSGL
ncbi:MAG: YeeE/YedE thiosulfate transporter family protein [Deltaproteobacteria bacterium]|nr:YeeE/YedE thiosulfate transporter family protein [Deltaproteobacteria bacterium]